MVATKLAPPTFTESVQITRRVRHSRKQRDFSHAEARCEGPREVPDFGQPQVEIEAKSIEARCIKSLSVAVHMDSVANIVLSVKPTWTAVPSDAVRILRLSGQPKNESVVR